MYKWRQQGVPHRWRIAIVRASGGLVSFDDFDAFTEDEKPKKENA